MQQGFLDVVVRYPLLWNTASALDEGQQRLVELNQLARERLQQMGFDRCPPPVVVAGLLCATTVTLVYMISGEETPPNPLTAGRVFNIH